MKKIISIVLFSLILFSSSVYSQGLNESRVRFGLSVTPSFAWLMKVQPEQYLSSDGLRFNFSAGLNIDIPFLTKNTSILTGANILYCGGTLKADKDKGFLDKFNADFAQDLPSKTAVSVTDTTKAFSASEKMKLQYIEIPFMLKMKTPEIGALTYFLEIGLGTAINIGAKGDFSFDNVTVNPDIKTTDRNIYKDIAILRESLLVGLGVEYNMIGTTSLIFTANFNNGFIDIFKNDISNKPVTIKNNLISVSIGVLF
jgi:hypothetical protein